MGFAGWIWKSSLPAFFVSYPLSHPINFDVFGFLSTFIYLVCPANIHVFTCTVNLSWLQVGGVITQHGWKERRHKALIYHFLTLGADSAFEILFWESCLRGSLFCDIVSTFAALPLDLNIFILLFCKTALKSAGCSYQKHPDLGW